MLQKSTFINILKVFFDEPTSVHFIREISRKVGVAPTSIRMNIKQLLKEKLIKVQKSKPFDGYVADREDDQFLFYKRIYNLYSLYSLKELIVESVQPKAIILFGSYSKGEDIETSDVDLIVISKVKKEINFGKFEKILSRKINAMFIDKLEKLDDNIKDKAINGIVLYGEI